VGDGMCVVEYVTVLLAPRGIMHFDNNRLDMLIFSIIAKVKADRIEAVAKITEMGQ
jgi:hypothetical protein